MTTEPLTTQVFSYPDTRDIVGQATAALTELAARADTPRVEDTHLRAQIEQHQRWIARRELGQQIVDRIDPRATSRGMAVNACAPMGIEAPEEPMPAAWHRALEAVAALIEHRNFATAGVDKLERAVKANHDQLRAVVDPTDSGHADDLNDYGLARTVGEFIDSIRGALTDPGDDNPPVMALTEIVQLHVAQRAELAELRRRWEAVPSGIRATIVGIASPNGPAHDTPTTSELGDQGDPFPATAEAQ